GVLVDEVGLLIVGPRDHHLAHAVLDEIKDSHGFSPFRSRSLTSTHREPIVARRQGEDNSERGVAEGGRASRTIHPVRPPGTGESRLLSDQSSELAIDVAALPPPAQRILDTKTPGPMRQMAAKGVAPGLKPHEALTVV